MNCQEARKLFEDALDRSLSGSARRRFDLHLSRCRDCHGMFAAEQAEHVRWFRALNEADVPRHVLPPDFADRLVAAVAVQGRERRSLLARFRFPRWAGIAAVLALAFLAFAAVVWTEGEGGVTGDADGGGGVADIPSVGNFGIENGESRIDGGDGATGRLPVDADGGGASSLPGVSHAAVDAVPKEKTKMNVEQAMQRAKRAGSAALAAVGVSLGAAADDPYQFIISGYPAADTCSVRRSAAIAVDTGAHHRPSGPCEMDSRFRTHLASAGGALKSTKYRGTLIRMK